MPNVMLKCKNCGASMQVDMQAKTVTCLHCGTAFLLSEILDKTDYKILEQNKDIDLDKKVKFNDAVKQGETYLYQADYVKAEESFKLALSIDEDNFKPYLGIVKAKTKNLNIIPPNDDYKNYAKKALALADSDDYYIVKSDLEKLEILKQENAKNKQNHQKNQEKQRISEENRRIKANFFSKIAYVLTGLIACAVLVGIVVTMVIKDREKKNQNSTVEITSSAQFLDLFENENILESSATIIIKNDIDFAGAELSPLAANDSFKGTFRGNGYKLKNFTVKNSSSAVNIRLGLFDTLDGANVSGIILENVTFKIPSLNETQSSITFGFIAGHAKDSTISLCGVEDNCKIEIQNTGKTLVLGGLAGSVENSTVKTSFSKANISVKENNNSKNMHYFGGVCGFCNDSTVLNCLFAGNLDVSITGTQGSKINMGGIAGFSQFVTNKASISNSAFAGSMKCVSTTLDCLIAAVTNYTGEIDINQIYENYIVALNIENSDGKIDAAVLSDYDATKEYFTVCESLEDFKTQIENVFSDNWWDKTNDIPTLKNKITGQNTGDFLFQNFKKFVDCKVH